MDYKFIILGVASWIVAFWIYPMALKRLANHEFNHLTIKGVILPILLFILGLYLIARELAKIL